MEDETNTEGNRRIYVQNLDSKVQWQDLKDFFNDNIGDVTRADVMGRGCGTVEFGSASSASRAINELNETTFRDRVLQIREDRHSDKALGGRSGIGSYSASAGFTDNKSARVYVGNLPWDISEQDLIDHMSEAGEVKACEILLTSNFKSKGCAIVEYTTSEEAEDAKEKLKDSTMKGRKISVREDREEGISSTGAPIPSSGRPPYQRSFGRPGNFRGGGQFSRQSGTNRVFVSNLAWDVSWQDLKDYFREVGNVRHSDVLHGPDGKSKGCGIVEFDSPQTAREAIESRNNTTLKGRLIHVREDREQEPVHFSGRGFGGGWNSGGGSYRNHYTGNRNTWGNQNSSTSAPREDRQIIVSGLDESVDWRDVKDFFQNVQFAEVLPRSDGDDENKAIVRFKTPEEADSALDKDGEVLHGKTISIRKDEKYYP